MRVVVPNENLDILLGRGGGGTVTINNIPQANNGDEVILTSGGVEVVRVGGHLHVILTERGVRVSWDGLYRVEVTVSTSWRGRLCGLCGNYNGDSSDDFSTPDGTIVSSPDTFGGSWVVDNSTVESCNRLLVPSDCPASVMEEARTQCAALIGRNFNQCNAYVDPISYIDSCVYDYCNCNRSEQNNCYCHSLSTYASACAATGTVLLNRNIDCGRFGYNIAICVS